MGKYDKIKSKKDKHKSKFKLGQFVKIFKKRGIFARGFHQNVTKEYFKIYHIDRNLSKDRYYLKDISGDKIIGSLYEEYLVPYIPSSQNDKLYRNYIYLFLFLNVAVKHKMTRLVWKLHLFVLVYM